MKINNRLKKITEFINDNSFILDVGCDHALLDIFLVLNRKNIKTIASDLRKEPLAKAKQNVIKYNCLDKIVFKQGDGIGNLNKNIDTIVISGMGALTIINILEKDLTKITNQRLIISPNNEESLVRIFLNKNNFKIANEVLVEDNSKIYPIMVFEKGKEKLSKKELDYGSILLKNKNVLFKKYYRQQLNGLIKIKKNLPNKYLIKKIQINKKIREIKGIL